MQIPVEEAIALAEELTQIRVCYGDDCLRFVEQALRRSRAEDWRTTVSGAVNLWSSRYRHVAFAS